jgi:hypothetical protein
MPVIPGCCVGPGLERLDVALKNLGTSLEQLGRQSIFQHDDTEAREGVGDLGRGTLLRKRKSVPIPHDLGMAFDKIRKVHFMFLSEDQRAWD